MDRLGDLLMETPSPEFSTCLQIDLVQMLHDLCQKSYICNLRIWLGAINMNAIQHFFHVDGLKGFQAIHVGVLLVGHTHKDKALVCHLLE